jgi:hypothetical protein
MADELKLWLVTVIWQEWEEQQSGARYLLAHGHSRIKSSDGMSMEEVRAQVLGEMVTEHPQGIGFQAVINDVTWIVEKFQRLSDEKKESAKDV